MVLTPRARPCIGIGVTLAAALACLPAPALANGAMSLALSTFSWPLWLGYVAVTVVAEAALLGRWLRLGAREALPTSVLANAVTGLIGGFLSGPAGYCIYGMFGSRLNPNPFGQTLFAFVVFGIASALVEGFFWRARVPVSDRRVWGLSLVAHLLVIPLGLAVLLLPTRPYVGLEAQVGHQRRNIPGSPALTEALQCYVSDHDRLPAGPTLERVIEQLQPEFRRAGDGPWRREYLERDRWTLAYEPSYGRFDTREMRRQPIEWNAGAPRGRLSKLPEGTVWLLRQRYAGRFPRGLVLELPGGMVTRSSDARELGW